MSNNVFVRNFHKMAKIMYLNMDNGHVREFFFFQKHPKQMTDLGRYFQNPDCPETGRFPYRTPNF